MFGKKKAKSSETNGAATNGDGAEPTTNGATEQPAAGWSGSYADDNAAAPAAAKGDKPLQDGEAVKQLDPEVIKKISAVRTKIHETFGQIALSMMAIPRYRQLSIMDLNQYVLEPLIRDRIAIAKSGDDATPGSQALAGIAIWASVSQEVDGKIREQIRAGVFPIRLKPEEWTSGEINWLLDVIAPSQRLTTSVIANFRQVVKTGDMRIHPIVTRLVDPEALKKMGAAPIKAEDAESAPAG